MSKFGTMRPCILCSALTNVLRAWFDRDGKRTAITYALCGGHPKGQTTRVRVAAVLGIEA